MKELHSDDAERIVSGNPGRDTWRPPRNKAEAYIRQSAVLAGLGVLALLGKEAYEIVSELREDSKQPVCVVPIESGDTISGMRENFRRHGDKIAEVKKVVDSDGREQVELNPPGAVDPEAPAVEALKLEVDGRVYFSHIDPDACRAVGGKPGQ